MLAIIRVEQPPSLRDQDEELHPSGDERVEGGTRGGDGPVARISGAVELPDPVTLTNERRVGAEGGAKPRQSGAVRAAAATSES